MNENNDAVGEAFKTVRDATVLNPNLSNDEAIAVLNMVLHEMNKRNYEQWVESVLDN